MNLTAQLLRVLGSVFSIVSDKSNDKKTIFLYNGIANFFVGIQYFMLDAFTGGLCSMLAIGRNLIFYKFKKKNLFLVLLIYIAILVFLNLNKITNFVTFIPVLLVIIYSFGLYSNNTKILKYAIIITCILEIWYDYVYLAYAGIIVCTIDAILVARSLTMLNKKKRRKKKKKY